MGRKSTRKLYAFVDALVATGARELVSQLATDEDRAREIMRDVAHSICFQYARSIMYVPADLEFQLGQRDQSIWERYGQDGPDGAKKYTPHRVAQLAEEHQLTTAHVYCIVKLMHRREVENRQGRLPGFGEDPDAASGRDQG